MSYRVKADDRRAFFAPEKEFFMEDNRIIDMFFQRDQQALRETELKYGSYLQTIAYRVLGSREDAEECVNDALLSAWNSIPPQRPSVFRMFLAKLARNHSLNRYKSERTAKRGGGEAALAIEELEECVAGSSDTEAGAMTEALQKGVNTFVRSLPEREGDIFLRRYFFLENVKDIAASYGISQDNASVILSRTRKKLREYLEKEQLL